MIQPIPKTVKFQQTQHITPPPGLQKTLSVVPMSNQKTYEQMRKEKMIEIVKSRAERNVNLFKQVF